MAWINSPHREGGMDDLMQAQVGVLCEQMNTMAPEYVGDASGDVDPMSEAFKNAARRMRRYRR
jgi:hypothetical protein